jgi:hypothetical protein
MEIDRTAYQRRYGLDVVEEHIAVWEAFADLGWVTVSDDRVTILGDGLFYLPLIQNALGHDRLEQMRHSRTETTKTVAQEPTVALPQI